MEEPEYLEEDNVKKIEENTKQLKYILVLHIYLIDFPSFFLNIDYIALKAIIFFFFQLLVYLGNHS